MFYDTLRTSTSQQTHPGSRPNCHHGGLNPKRTFKALLEDIEDEVSCLHIPIHNLTKFSNFLLGKALVASGRSPLVKRRHIARVSLITSSTPPVAKPPTSPSHAHPGISHVIGFLDNFEHKELNGAYVYMVLEVLGEILLGPIKHHQNKGVPGATWSSTSIQTESLARTYGTNHGAFKSMFLSSRDRL